MEVKKDKMDKQEILEKRIEGEIERRIEVERKMKDKINKLDKRVQHLEEENRS